jgi:hypothetical protein
VKPLPAKPPEIEPQLRECPGCGLFQTVPALAPGVTAQCVRCPTILRRTSGHSFDGTCIGEAQPIIQLPIGEQPPIRDDYGAAKLDGSAACARQVKSEGR